MRSCVRLGPYFRQRICVDAHSEEMNSTEQQRRSKILYPIIETLNDTRTLYCFQKKDISNFNTKKSCHEENGGLRGTGIKAHFM